jgi:hypothetical protein
MNNTESGPASTGFTTHAANVAFIVLAVVIMFWRVILAGETLIDVAALDNQLPWGYSAAHSDYPYNRTDLTDTYLTREYFVVQAYRDGERPLWNPYTMAGHPIYADGVTHTMSPFLLFYTFLDLPLGYSVARISELVFAAVFMYAFLVGIRIDHRGALLGSLVFALSAHSMLHLTGLGWWGGLMWLPLIFLFIDRALTRSSYRDAIIAGVLFAMQFFCGFMANQIYYLGAIVLYYLFFAFGAWDKRRGGAGRSSALTMMVVTLAVGFALSATQWAPVMELLQYSNRRIVPTDQGYIYLPPWYAATLVFPNLFGAARDAEILNLFTALHVSHDHILYLGVVSLLPLGFSLYSFKGADRRVRFFALLAMIALFVMMAAPLYVHLTRFIPVVQSIRVITRAGVLFVFAASVLIAIGVDLLLAADTLRLERFGRVMRTLVILVAGVAVVAVIASYSMRAAGVFEGVVGERPAGSGAMDFARRAASALAVQFSPPKADILVPLVLLAAGFLLLRRFSSRRLSAAGFASALILLVVPDLGWSSLQFNSTHDRSRVFPPTKITEMLRSLPPGRVLVAPADLETNRRADTNREKIIAPPNTLLAYQIRAVTGKDQLFPKAYREFCSLIEPQPNLSHVVFDETQSRYFDLLSVRYVLTHASRPPIDGYVMLASDEGVSLYENTQAIPRGFFVENVNEAASHEEALRLLADASFDPKVSAVIEADGSLPAARTGDLASAGVNKATMAGDTRNLVVISAESENGGWLVLADNYYPGWSAMIDEQPVEMVRANYTMRAVKVPPGRHVVYFEFDPPILRLATYVSLGSAAVTALAFVFIFLRGRRRATEWR